MSPEFFWPPAQARAWQQPLTPLSLVPYSSSKNWSALLTWTSPLLPLGPPPVLFPLLESSSGKHPTSISHPSTFPASVRSRPTLSSASSLVFSAYSITAPFFPHLP